MTVALVVLCVVVAFLLAERSWAARQWQQTERRLVGALLSRHSGDLAALESVENQPRPARIKTRRATADTPGINEYGQLIDERGAVVDESAMVGLGGA